MLRLWLRRAKPRHNPEPGTLNLITQTDLVSNLFAISWYIKVYGHFCNVNYEVCTNT